MRKGKEKEKINFKLNGGLFTWPSQDDQMNLTKTILADRTSKFFGVKLMFVGVMNFGQIQLIRFVVVKFFGHILANFRSSWFGQVN